MKFKQYTNLLRHNYDKIFNNETSARTEARKILMAVNLWNDTWRQFEKQANRKMDKATIKTIKGMISQVVLREVPFNQCNNYLHTVLEVVDILFGSTEQL